MSNDYKKNLKTPKMLLLRLEMRGLLLQSEKRVPSPKHMFHQNHEKSVRVDMRLDFQTHSIGISRHT